jgi:AraC family transcriptional regulator of adaptative response/methylated-DNA-[protein]-cysteine methyltransferase
MKTTTLPPDSEMFTAFSTRDADYDGVFFTAVKTTGIFCRPACPARKPLRKNIHFFPSARDCLGAGYRPCKRCTPLAKSGDTPEWIKGLIEEVERDPARRWKDQDLRAMSIQPERARRWFQSHHGMTFHQYQRARRLGLAMGRIQLGEELTRTAFDHGFDSESGFRDAFKGMFGNTPGDSRDGGGVAMTRILTPLGPMLAGATEDGLCLLEFTDRRMLETQLKRLYGYLKAPTFPGSNSHLEQIDRELAEYFAGTRREFSVPLVTPGTDFQKSVWNELARIPYGITRSYDDIAKNLGKAGAQRAVGKANGDNRIAIVIPCHRVIRSDGTLSGYGGGVWRKKKLLELEGHKSVR